MLRSDKQARCPRSGYVVLTADHGSNYVMRTTCKTWGCQVCRKRVLSYVKLRMEYGCSKLERFYFITVTLQADNQRYRDARYVRTKWELMIRSLKSQSPNLSWFKIVELTKRGIPHLHLLVGGLGQRIDSCAPKGRFRHTLIKVHRTCKVDCLIHEWSKVWYAATGDSFVVDAREGYTPARLANYLGKYLVKGFYHREELEEIGYRRRWSCSRNWPKPKKLETKQSEGLGWRKIEVVNGYGMRDYFEARVSLDKDKEAISQVGDDMVLSLQSGRVKGAQRIALEKMLKGMQNVG